MTTLDATNDHVAAPATTGQAEQASTPEAEADQRVRAWGHHPVNLRITLLGRYYVAFVAGKERRSDIRRLEERQKHPLHTLGNTLLMLAVGLAIGLALYGLVVSIGLWALPRFVLAA